MVGFNGKLSNILIDEDQKKDGILKTEKVTMIIRGRNIEGLQTSELNQLMSHMDQ